MLCGPREALVLEISARHGAVRRPHRGLLTTTNHYQSPAMQGLKGRFPPRPPYSVLSAYHFTEAYSQARNHRLQELAADRRLGPMDLQKILADPAIANAGTAVCAVFQPADRRLVGGPGGDSPGEPGTLCSHKIMELTGPGSGSPDNVCLAPVRPRPHSPAPRGRMASGSSGPLPGDWT